MKNCKQPQTNKKVKIILLLSRVKKKRKEKKDDIISTEIRRALFVIQKFYRALSRSLCNFDSVLCDSCMR